MRRMIHDEEFLRVLFEVIDVTDKGLPLGFYLTDWLFKTAIEEHYDFGAFINMSTYVISAIGTFIVSYVVSKVLSRKINKIDMVSSLKGNE